jgi:hypothetical protein
MYRRWVLLSYEDYTLRVLDVKWRQLVGLARALLLARKSLVILD